MRIEINYDMQDKISPMELCWVEKKCEKTSHGNNLLWRSY